MNRESLSVHPFPSLPTLHGTESSRGRLDKSIWHGSLHRCSLNHAECRTDIGRNLHLEYRHLGACLTQEQWGFTRVRNAGPEPPGTRPVSKGLCPGPATVRQLASGCSVGRESSHVDARGRRATKKQLLILQPREVSAKLRPEHGKEARLE